MSPYLLVSRLLQYPHDQLIELHHEIRDICKTLPKGIQRRSIGEFLEYLDTTPGDEQRAHYVATFDFNKRTSLYLSFHGLGDRRERGMAMLNLKQRYRAVGFELLNGELPDYLPVMLEFCALAETELASELLEEFRESIELVRAALRSESSPYVFLLDAVLTEQPALTKEQQEAIIERAAEGPPTESVGLEPFALTQEMVEGTEPRLTGACSESA